jgi:energy-coupling factor transporter ATP-binding protein EcfA2
MVRVGDAGESKSLIVARDLGKTYRRGSEQLHVLQGVNLDVEQGDFVAFMGPSGSGKTTLLNLIGGLDLPTTGSVRVAGDEITRLSRARLGAWRAARGLRVQMYKLIGARRVPRVIAALPVMGRAGRRPWRPRWIVGLGDRMQHKPAEYGRAATARRSRVPSWRMRRSCSATAWAIVRQAQTDLVLIERLVSDPPNRADGCPRPRAALRPPPCTWTGVLTT